MIEEIKKEKIAVTNNRVVFVPTILLSKKEIETLNNRKVPKTYLSLLKCNVFHIKNEELETTLSADTGSVNRALALRIVSKAINLKPRDITGKMAMLSVAASLGSWAPQEADRLVRSI